MPVYRFADQEAAAVRARIKRTLAREEPNTGTKALARALFEMTRDGDEHAADLIALHLPAPYEQPRPRRAPEEPTEPLDVEEFPSGHFTIRGRHTPYYRTREAAELLAAMCTGWYDADQDQLHHDSDTCPVHERGEDER